MTNALDEYIRALAYGRLNGYGYIDDLSDEWINKMCEIATEVDKEFNLSMTGIHKDPTNREELKNWTVFVTQSNVSCREAFDLYITKVINIYEKVLEP